MPTFPEKQVAYGVSLIHGVEELTYLGVLPHERPLDFREANLPQLYIIEQIAKAITNFSENCVTHVLLSLLAER